MIGEFACSGRNRPDSSAAGHPHALGSGGGCANSEADPNLNLARGRQHCAGGLPISRHPPYLIDLIFIHSGGAASRAYGGGSVLLPL